MLDNSAPSFLNLFIHVYNLPPNSNTPVFKFNKLSAQKCACEFQHCAVACFFPTNWMRNLSVISSAICFSGFHEQIPTFLKLGVSKPDLLSNFQIEMRTFINQVGAFVRERLELRGKMDEPTLRKYRTVFGIHVRVSILKMCYITFIYLLCRVQPKLLPLLASLFTPHFWVASFIGIGTSVLRPMWFLPLVIWFWSWV